MGVSMKKLIVAALLAAGLFSSSPTWAATQGAKTVGEILGGCRLLINTPSHVTAEQLQTAHHCLGMLEGISGLMGRLGGATDLSSAQKRVVGFCSHTFVSWGQMAQSYVNWASANPSEWQIPAWRGMLRALSGTWPCR